MKQINIKKYLGDIISTDAKNAKENYLSVKCQKCQNYGSLCNMCGI